MVRFDAIVAAGSARAIPTGRSPARAPVPAAALAFRAPCAIPPTNLPNRHRREEFQVDAKRKDWEQY